MKKRHIYSVLLVLLLSCIGRVTLNADYLAYTVSLPEVEVEAEAPSQPEDTIPPSRFPVSKTMPEEYKDITTHSPADLKDPENVKTTIEYDIKTGIYIVRTKIGDMEIGTPLTLTPEEYQNYSLQESLRSYFRQKNDEEMRKELEKGFNITDMQFDIGPAERIFGKGGVRVKTQGSAEISMGIKQNKTKNPSLPERARNRTFFNFDENVQLNVRASVGSKVNFNMNYNTESTFDFDQQQLKLAYTGEEDEIIKTLEAGNVSMTTNNSLINGGAALFGIKADMQFGKLRVNTIFAQQNSQSQTVNSKGGAQTKPFEITVDSYDENRHFFLSHYFRDNYDNALANLPEIRSGIVINKVEVWITNKSANFDQARNIVAFTDLGEYSHISNSGVRPNGSQPIPYNNANTLYSQITSMEGGRDKGKANQVFSSLFEGGREFEKVESARKLAETEYSVNKQLGYISLRTKLQNDEVLAVAYEYQYGGNVYQVGEFSTDNSTNTTNCLFVKTLKGTTLSPAMMYWDLMMKNVYDLGGAYSVQSSNFRLNILYQSDTTGVYLNYIPEGDIKNEILLRVMNLDRLNSNGQAYADGFFDFLEGYTILPENGKVVFPVVEPFGSHLKKKINNPSIADKYVYQELYDSTMTVAKQIAEKNKFILRGEYQASSGAEIQLGASNVTRGSVKVTAGGVVLTENVDYIVDYTSGTVTVLNENIIASGTPISVNLEDQSTYNMKRKTMMGVDLNYQFTKDFSLGATIMHLSEMPLTTKTAYGDESVKNTLWGLNMSYRGESQWLTNMVDKLPLLTLTKPSQITFNAEFAHLIAGHYENKYTGKYSYLDDFESTQTGFDLLTAYPWKLASTPYEDSNPKFPEAGPSYVNNIEYGKNRALFAWYNIDGIFTRQNSSLMPSHLRSDKEQLSNHYVRAVKVEEIYPYREQGITDATLLQTLNVAYYPNERGPYNLDADKMNPDGTLMNPESRWGGMMRKIDQSDFETANIEYIEFWVMDPFIYKPTANGGDLYFNIGDISEDILKDEKKFYENGLPVDGDTAKVDFTVWGKVPKQQSTVYAFDNTSGARRIQDVGFNGLSSDDERTYDTYANYLAQVQSKVSPEAYNRFEADPAGDNYRYYRGSDLDRDRVSILDRYKYYNGPEGNSQASEDTGQSYDTSSQTTPDVEDLNQDNTMNENEKYFQYRVSLRPNDMKVGQNYIVNIDTPQVTLANGDKQSVTWYQFKVPVKDYEKKVGSISDFKSVRFMRMYMTGFQDTTILRFGKFELVRGEWRTYEQDLSNPNTTPVINGTIDVSTVNIEENSNKTPVNYVLPPGLSRAIDPGQPQVIQQNEQSLAMKINNLAPQDARAIYKGTFYDFRQYKRLQLYTHAEAQPGSDLNDRDMSVFIRLGSDYKNNYYEYEIPLSVTPAGQYSDTERERVWPISNMFDFRFEVLTNLKLSRNRAQSEGRSVSYQNRYSELDPDNNLNTITVVGNPSLAEVKVIMIGVRNKSNQIRNGEVWVNELRVTDFNEDGGWAANANLNIALSDLGTINLGGRIETAGFGGLDQTLNQRRLDDYKQYNIATNVELGKFFPEKAKVSIPLYYAFSKEIIDPKYNPLDQDIELKEALDATATKAEKDSILNFARERTTVKSIAFNNIKVDIKSKTPMPYDPANFSIGYSYSQTQTKNPETEYETTTDWRANFAYNYTPYLPPWRPFQKVKQNNGYTKYIKQLSLNYLPSNISFQTSMYRNYYELQLRDLSSIQAGGDNTIPVSFSQNFYWDRAFSISWNLTPSLRASFSSGTNARIEEPYVQVNKKLNPEGYELWKDSVKQSIADLGTPMKYDQRFNVSYSLPFQYIPVLDWVNGNVMYNATYNWDRGAELDQYTELGNTIRNQRQIDIQGGFNLLNLYNKVPFLRTVNQKFTSTTATSSSTNTRRGPQQGPVAPRKRPKVEKDVTLSLDSGTVVQHGMLTKKLFVRAKGADGRSYKIKFKAIDNSKIRIENRDTVTLHVTMTPGADPTEHYAYEALQHTSRFLMMLRRINVTYTMTDGMTVPGFRPGIGDVFGQGRMDGVLTPGLGFAFGSVRKSYIDDFVDRDWLVMTQTTINPALISNSKNLNINMSLEPFTGLKIDLTANRLDTRNTEIQYMYNDRPEIMGGSFSMTTISIGSAFSGMGDLNNGYASKTFDKFLAYRKTIAERLQSRYNATTYPNTGFLRGTSFANNPYSPENGVVSENSTDVLIPAFLAAYTGKSASSIDLTAFPSLSSLLPNWRITYDGLIRIPVIKRYFKALQLSHQYRSVYAVGAFSSFLNWVDAGQDGLGFVRDVLTNNPTPSSPYDISAVSITEGFSPLIGVDGTLLNNVTLRTEFRKTRNLNLNISSYQLVESLSNELIVGMGYKLTEFNKILKRKASRDFSNDLTLRMDFSYRKMQSLIRKIEDGTAQATSGNIAKTLQFSADYGLSRALTVRAFYDLQINEPLISSTSYPTTNSNYGVSLRFSLAQ